MARSCFRPSSYPNAFHMPPKRKYVATVVTDEPASKRQLRSSKVPAQITPLSSLAKPKVASRRAQSTPRKRAEQAKIEIDAVEDESNDELDALPALVDEGSLENTHYLPDETNTIRVCPPASLNVTEESVHATPRARRGRPKKQRKGTAGIEDVEEDLEPLESVKTPNPRGHSPNNTTVEKKIPSARRGRASKKQAAQETIPSAEEAAESQTQQVEQFPDVFSKLGGNTPTHRRSSRITSVVEVVLTPSTRTKAKASRRTIPPPPEKHLSSDENQYYPLKLNTLPPLSENTSSSTAFSPEDNVVGAEETDDQDADEMNISSPAKQISRSESDPSTDLSGPLPDHLHSCFNAYKLAVLKSLHSPNIASSISDSSSVNDIAAKQLADLVDGTVLRAEGNSCLVLGPRGSGKSQMVDACLEQVAINKPIIVRLCGWIQTTDRHALREIAFQLLQQTGTALHPNTETDLGNPESEADEDENPFLDAADHASGESTLTLPPSSHLHALIPVLLTLSRPVIVVLDAFDLFALHPRQSLLYCLLDTVQNCRASSDNRGIAVIGITSRVDTAQLLEKRVKSRFSGRTIRTAPPGSLQDSLATLKTILQPSDVCAEDEHLKEWKQRWTAGLQCFLEYKGVANTINETFGLTRNFKVIIRMMTTCIIQLTPSQPYLSPEALTTSAERQRSRPGRMHLNNLSYPALCLLIASAHAATGGHMSFTFEMLYESFRDQVRALASAPVQFNGGSIGMMRCPREVLMSTFEDLVAAKIFVCIIAAPSSVAKQFVKYRCVVNRHDIKAIIEKSGNTNLKKWLSKSH